MTATPSALPAVTSPHLVLANATREELTGNWNATHPSWGAALDLPTYLDREAFLFEQPLAGGAQMAPWVLTTSNNSSTEDGHGQEKGESQRPVLSSCETLQFRAIVREKDGTVREGWAHGVASVFTFTDRRGRGYAAKMMDELATTLRRRQAEKDGDALFSVLFSDIGKVFYAKRGWKPYESAHLRFPASAAAAAAAPPHILSDSGSGSTAQRQQSPIKAIQLGDLPALAETDCQLIRSKLFAPGHSSSKKRVAVLPDYDMYRRHFARRDFVCQRLLHRTPSSCGALYDGAAGAGRAWAVWCPAFSGPLDQPEKNTLYILRFVVENDEAISDEELGAALGAILGAARDEAREWGLGKVEMWNPNERVRKLALGIKELEASYVVREDDSICSLQWLGDEADDEVEWVVSEKFEWC